MIHVTDWMSTILNLAGGVPPNDTDSIDQWSLISSKDEKPSARKGFIYDYVIKRDQDNRIAAGIRYKYFACNT